MNDTPSEPATTVAGRYQIQTTLGAGTQGRTFLARDLDEEREVVLKRLAMTDAPDWKTIELFERQRDVLRDLNHPGIPSYFDAFQEEQDGTATFYIVREYVRGESLEALRGDEAQWSASDLRAFIRQMLSILSYLESRRPPIVHRDIKPQNIIRTPDGTHRLIDFGAVQNAIMRETGGSTLIGTKGYLPVEQLMGRATPASDQFALGMTVAALLFGEPPTDEEPAQLRDRIARETGDAQLAGVVERLIQHQPGDRFPRASDARSQLTASPTPSRSPAPAKKLALAPIEYQASEMERLLSDCNIEVTKQRYSLLLRPKNYSVPGNETAGGFMAGVFVLILALATFGLLYAVVPDLALLSFPLFIAAGVVVYRNLGDESGQEHWKFVLGDDWLELYGDRQLPTQAQSSGRIWLEDVVEVSITRGSVVIVTADVAHEVPWFGRRSEAIAQLIRERVDATNRQLT